MHTTACTHMSSLQVTMHAARKNEHGELESDLVGARAQRVSVPDMLPCCKAGWRLWNSVIRFSPLRCSQSLALSG